MVSSPLDLVLARRPGGKPAVLAHGIYRIDSDPLSAPGQVVCQQEHLVVRFYACRHPRWAYDPCGLPPAIRFHAVCLGHFFAHDRVLRLFTT
ncbi:MAG: hypothetical protein ACK56F_08745, partial [bacterium]